MSGKVLDMQIQHEDIISNIGFYWKFGFNTILYSLPCNYLKDFKRNLQTSHLVTIDQQIPRYENIWNKLYRDSRVGTSFWFSEEWTLDSIGL